MHKPCVKLWLTLLHSLLSLCSKLPDQGLINWKKALLGVNWTIFSRAQLPVPARQGKSMFLSEVTWWKWVGPFVPVHMNTHKHAVHKQMYAWAHTHTDTHVCLNTHIYMHMYTGKYKCMCMCVHTRIHTALLLLSLYMYVSLLNKCSGTIPH